MLSTYAAEPADPSSHFHRSSFAQIHSHTLISIFIIHLFIKWDRAACRLLPVVVQVQVAAEDRADVSGEAQCVQHRQQVQESRVTCIRKPAADWDGIVRICPVSAGRVVQYKDGGEVSTYGRQVFGIAPIIQCAVLPEVPAPQNLPLVVQSVGHRCAVNFHTRREHDQLKPLTHLSQDET